MSRREDRIEAFAGVLDHGIAGIVDEVHVVAGPAEHGVGAGIAVEKIVAGVAGQRVGVAVAVSLQVRAARQGQVFDVLRQPVMRRRHHRVGALVGALGYRVAGIVDKVGVVADTTDQGVRADTAVERIIAPFAEKRIRACLRGQGVVAPLAMDYVARSCTAQRVVVCCARE